MHQLRKKLIKVSLIILSRDNLFFHIKTTKYVHDWGTCTIEFIPQTGSSHYLYIQVNEIVIFIHNTLFLHFLQGHYLDSFNFSVPPHQSVERKTSSVSHGIFKTNSISISLLLFYCNWDTNFYNIKTLQNTTV